MRYRSSKVKDFQARHIENEVRDFIAEAADVRTKYSVILGHVPFGLHRYMDSGTGYLSVIRNPVDRLVSDY